MEYNMICHLETPCSVVELLQATAKFDADGDLQLGYVLIAGLQSLAIPISQPPIFVDGLWQHTCFEAFICVQGEAAYYEYNFSPSSQWAAYAFSDYRKQISWTASCAPSINIKQVGDQLMLDATLAKTDLPPNPEKKLLQIGLTAVIEEVSGSKSYWALKHPTSRPDFHNKNGFILKLCL